MTEGVESGRENMTIKCHTEHKREAAHNLLCPYPAGATSRELPSILVEELAMWRRECSEVLLC